MPKSYHVTCRLFKWRHGKYFFVMKLNSWSWNREFMKLKLWIREVEIVNSRSWNREFMKFKSRIREIEIGNSCRWNREVEVVNSWSWIVNSVFWKRELWIHEDEIGNSWSWNGPTGLLYPGDSNVTVFSVFLRQSWVY
jgi:hypothetical protein